MHALLAAMSFLKAHGIPDLLNLKNRYRGLRPIGIRAMDDDAEKKWSATKTLS
jgi:hypothetical protein